MRIGVQLPTFKLADHRNVMQNALQSMSTNEIKIEIQKSLDHVPDSVLQYILDFLRMAEKQPTDRLTLVKNFRNILAEDKELLERLAK